MTREEKEKVLDAWRVVEQFVENTDADTPSARTMAILKQVILKATAENPGLVTNR